MKSGGDAGSVVEHFHNAKTEKISLKPIVFLFGDSPFRISFFETVFYLIGGFMGVFAMNASNSSIEGECVVVPMNVQA